MEDLEALRVALGYSQLNLYGISYGSRVAQHFVRRFPDSTRTVVLDGVAAPQVALGPGGAIEAQASYVRDDDFDPLYEASVQATEEAIVNALIAAEDMTTVKAPAGAVCRALPHDQLLDVMRRYGRCR